MQQENLYSFLSLARPSSSVSQHNGSSSSVETFASNRDQSEVAGRNVPSRDEDADEIPLTVHPSRQGNGAEGESGGPSKSKRDKEADEASKFVLPSGRVYNAQSEITAPSTSSRDKQQANEGPRFVPPSVHNYEQYEVTRPITLTRDKEAGEGPRFVPPSTHNEEDEGTRPSIPVKKEAYEGPRFVLPPRKDNDEKNETERTSRSSRDEEADEAPRIVLPSPLFAGIKNVRSSLRSARSSLRSSIVGGLLPQKFKDPDDDDDDSIGLGLYRLYGEDDDEESTRQEKRSRDEVREVMRRNLLQIARERLYEQYPQRRRSSARRDSIGSGISVDTSNRKASFHKQPSELALAGEKMASTNSRISWYASVAMILYVFIGVVVYCLGEGWSVREALYFIIVSFTTVGYGDMHPSSSWMKLFSIIYAVVGICLIGLAIGYAGQMFVRMHSDESRKNEKKKMSDIMNMFGDDEDDVKASQKIDESLNEECKRYNLPLPKHLRHGKLKQKSDEGWFTITISKSNVLYQNAQKIYPYIESLWTKDQYIIHGIFVVTVGAFALRILEGWSLVDAGYWTIITCTTIGYGDFAPANPATQWFCIFFIPVAVFVMTEVLSRIAEGFLKSELLKARKDFISCELTIDDLIAMDADKNGHVEKLEFFEFMLIAMGKVDQGLLNKLHKQFDWMDDDASGTLEIDDLKAISRRKVALEKKRRMLELEKYKRFLLEKGSMKKERPLNRFAVVALSAQIKHQDDRMRRRSIVDSFDEK